MYTSKPLQETNWKCKSLSWHKNNFSANTKKHYDNFRY